MQDESIFDTDDIVPVLGYNENRTVVSLDVVCRDGLTFETYKEFLHDFLKQLDESGEDLFDDSSLEVQDN